MFRVYGFIKSIVGLKDYRSYRAESLGMAGGGFSQRKQQPSHTQRVHIYKY